MSDKRTRTRLHILDTALKILVESEAPPKSMAALAKAAGITRQTVYDHFESRSELLIDAILRFGNELNVDGRLAASRAAATGEARLAAYTEAMITFFPEIYPLQKALTRLGEADQEARAAWDNRLAAMKEGCAAAIEALSKDGRLTKDLQPDHATDYYFSLLSIEAWAYCVLTCGWPQDVYLDHLHRVTRAVFVQPG